MKNITKLEKVRKFLADNGIKCHEPRKRGKRGHSDLALPDLRISIKISGDDDQCFYERHKKRGFPVFIRDGETPRFVLAKVQDVIIKSMTRKQMSLLARNRDENDSNH